MAASFSFILLFKLIAFVIANQRSTVIITKVNTDKWLANTVRKPAALQPEPVINKGKCFFCYFAEHKVKNGNGGGMKLWWMG